MDSSLLSLLTLPFIIMSVIIMLITKLFTIVVVRSATMVAKVFPDKYEPWWQWLWKENILPAAPIVIGGLMGYFVVDYPYPDVLASSVTSRTFCGVMAGFVSVFIFPRFMFYYKKFAPKKLDDAVKKVQGSKKPELPK